MKSKTFRQLYKQFEGVLQELEMNPDLVTHYDGERAKQVYNASFRAKVKRFYNNKYILQLNDKRRK